MTRKATFFRKSARQGVALAEGMVPTRFSSPIESQVHARRRPGTGEDEELIAKLDVARFLLLLDLRWNDLFRRRLSHDHRTWIKELISTKNKGVHAGPVDLTDEDAWRALDTMIRLVEPIDAGAMQRLRTLARTVRFGTVEPSTLANEVGLARPQ